MIFFVLWSVVGLFALSILAIALARHPIGTHLTYGTSLIISLVLVAAALAPTDAGSLTLPLGLPWLGAHFRVDALARFFLGLVNFGNAAASLYALGYG